MKVSGYIITKNNGRSLKWALESVYKYLDEIIIVDSGSTDNTVEIAKQYTDKIYFNEFKDFSDQRNFAIKKCTGDWIFTMDADEVMGENFFEFKKYLGKSYRAILFPRYNLVSLNPILKLNIIIQIGKQEFLKMMDIVIMFILFITNSKAVNRG